MERPNWRSYEGRNAASSTTVAVAAAAVAAVAAAVGAVDVADAMNAAKKKDQDVAPRMIDGGAVVALVVEAAVAATIFSLLSGLHAWVASGFPDAAAEAVPAAAGGWGVVDRDSR